MKRTILFIILLFITPTFFITFGQNVSIDDLIMEGVALHDEGNYKEAVVTYQQALAMDPNSILAAYEVSLSYLALEDYQNALKYSTTVINSNNKELLAGAYAAKSEALVGMNKVDDAISLLQEGLVKHGDEYLLHFNLALHYYKKNDNNKTLEHVKKAIDLDKTHSGAFLLNAYALKDSGLWVQSLLSYQMFLLLEPDSKRSKSAFEEMLNTMLIRSDEKPVKRSFVQQQMMRNQPDSVINSAKIPPLTIEEGLDRNLVYQAITSTFDSLKRTPEEENEFTVFKTVNKNIMKVLVAESSKGGIEKSSVFWTFYIPFFSHIIESNYYDTFCRYISVSYIPESLEWWQQNPGDAVNFVIWFEKGDDE